MRSLLRWKDSTWHVCLLLIMCNLCLSLMVGWYVISYWLSPLLTALPSTFVSFSSETSSHSKDFMGSSHSLPSKLIACKIAVDFSLYCCLQPLTRGIALRRFHHTWYEQLPILLAHWSQPRRGCKYYVSLSVDSLGNILFPVSRPTHFFSKKAKKKRKKGGVVFRWLVTASYALFLQRQFRLYVFCRSVCFCDSRS